MPSRAAVLRVALIQFLFFTTWVVYAIYLGDLLAAAGVDRAWLGALLLLDQLIFAVMDPLLGAWAERLENAVRRLAAGIVGLNLAASLAFAGLPLLGTSPGVLLTITCFWVVTASVLRAPLFVLLGRLPDAPPLPIRLAYVLAATALGAALSPFLGLWLKGISPLWPFLLSAITLALAGLSIVRPPMAPPAPSHAGPPPLGLYAFTFLLALGFQFHAFVASAPLYRRFSEADSLPWLLPTFWIGFNLALPLAAWRYRQQDPHRWPARLAALGAAALALGLVAPGLPWLLLGQLLLGACWAGFFMYGLQRAIPLGGLALGGWFAMLSLAAAARLALDKLVGLDPLTLEIAALSLWAAAVPAARYLLPTPPGDPRHA